MKPSVARDVALASLILCFSCGPAPAPARPASPPLVVGPASPTMPAGPPRAEALPAAPEDLALLVRVNDPEQLAHEVMSILPSGAGGGGALDPSQLVTVLLGRKLGALVDLTQPIDVASVGWKSPSFVVSMALKQEVDATLGAELGLREEGGLQHVTRPDDELGGSGSMKSCALTAAAGHAVTRLVCASEEAALVSSAAYLARAVASEPLDADARVTVPGRVLRDKRDSTTKAIGHAASAHLGTALVEQFLGEIDRIDGGIRFAGPRVELAFDLRLTGRESMVAKVLVPRSKPGPPPRAFYRLPADSIVALHTTGALAEDITPLRRALADNLGETLVHDGYPPDKARALRDRIEALLLTGGPLVLGAGIGGGRDGAEKALTTFESAQRPAEQARAETLARTSLIPWVLCEVEEPPSQWTQGLRELVKRAEEAERARAAGSKASTPRDPDGDHIDVRVATVDPAAKLPADTLHLEVLIAPRTKGARPTRKGHFFVVPKSGATWIGYSEDPKMIAARLRLAIDDAIDSGTLAKTPSAESLRSRPAIGAGIVSLVGLRYLTRRANSATTADDLRATARRASRAAGLGTLATDILAWTASADESAGSMRVSLNAQVSRQTAVEITKLLQAL